MPIANFAFVKDFEVKEESRVFFFFLIQKNRKRSAFENISKADKLRPFQLSTGKIRFVR